MELKEGMYVRTKEGRIDKIEEILDKEKAGSSRIIRTVGSEKDYFFGYEEWTDLFPPCHFIKASENIIDLIEEGDYVNGYSVIEKPYSYLGIKFISLDTDTSWGWGKGEMPAENIKSVLTREQFNNEKYIVNEVE